MNWHSKSIKNLSDDELKEANASIVGMLQFRQDQLDNKRERHSKFDLNNNNPVFDQIKTEIEAEIAKRNLWI